MTLLSTSRPLQPKVNVCHTHSSFIMPCFMDGLILKHSLFMWAFMCPSAALSHTLFLLKGPEIPISDFPRILGCLSNSPLCQAPSNSTHLARSLPPVTPQLFETCQWAVIGRSSQSQSYPACSLPLELWWPPCQQLVPPAPRALLNLRGLKVIVWQPGLTPWKRRFCLQPAPRHSDVLQRRRDIQSLFSCMGNRWREMTLGLRLFWGEV